MTQPQQSQRPMRVDDDGFDRLRSVQVFPSLGMLIDTVISTPHRPEPAEACCDVDDQSRDDYDYDEVVCEDCGEPLYNCDTYDCPALCTACRAIIAQTPLADVCGEAPYDEPEVGSVERLYPEGRQAELDDVA